MHTPFSGEEDMSQPTALLSVFHKDGITEFAQGLVALGWRILSSGGTAKHLSAAGVPVTDVAEISKLPAVLGHRVVTLVPQIHGGLLAADDQLEELEKLGWPRIDLVCVDLYPLKAEVESPTATRASVIEKTDIGGPTMLRSGAKGRRITVCDPADRIMVLNWLKAGRPDEEDLITLLCAKTEGIIADYCLTSARFHSMGNIDGMVGTSVIECRYGENPSWTARLFATDKDDPLAIHRFKQVAGAAPSYINLTDLDRGLRTLQLIEKGFDFGNPFGNGMVPKIAIAVKHGNCCGAAFDEDPNTVIRKMIDSDRISIHGAVVLTNFGVTNDIATTLRLYPFDETRNKRILDAVVAPSFDENAIETLGRKDGKCRMLQNPALAELRKEDLLHEQIRPVRGGFIRQTGTPFILDLSHKDMKRSGPLEIALARDLLLAWAVCATSTSNTVTLVKNGMLIGNGVGQQSRVRCAKLAVDIARENKHDVTGAVACTDSFFPFPDGAAALALAGVSAVFASSGSINDDVVIMALDRPGLVFWTLPDKVCRGFFHH